MRYQCDEADNLKYGWVQHDGRRFGKQVLVDEHNSVELTAYWIKFANDQWALRVEGRPLGSQQSHLPLSFILSVANNDYDRGKLRLTGIKKRGVAAESVVLEGATERLGEFSLVWQTSSGAAAPRHGSDREVAADDAYHEETSRRASPPSRAVDFGQAYFLGARPPRDDCWRVREMAGAALQQDFMHKYAQARQAVQQAGQPPAPLRLDQLDPVALVPTLPNRVEDDPSLLLVQKFVDTPFQLDLVWLPVATHKRPTLAAVRKSARALIDRLSTAIDEHSSQFAARFVRTFPMPSSYSPAQQAFAMATFSNLVGGIGYFHGTALHRTGPPSAPPFETAPLTLYTAVPSRSFFPRGFLWDEGFHQLLVAQWDPELAMDVLAHWLRLMDDDGWLPREQILGAEARSRVPREFVVQSSDVANPPTLLLPLRSLMGLLANASAVHEEDHYHDELFWRTSSADSLASQVRAFLTNAYPLLKRHHEWLERHQGGVAEGSYRWRGRSENHTLPSGLDDYPRVSPPSNRELHLDLHCWMAWSARWLAAMAAMVAPHDVPAFARKHAVLLARLDEYHWNDAAQAYQDVAYFPEPGLNNTAKQFSDHVGYVSLLPMALELLPPDSPHLGPVLDSIADPNVLSTPYGLRSLSLADPAYGTGENYWKGPIWININYLVLSALNRKYMREPGPFQERAAAVYKQLRSAIVANMFKEYQRTGFVWEQYHPTTGQGQRSHPFTGWSALVVLIMAELYP